MTQSRVWNRNRKTLAMATVCAMAIVCSALLISCGSRTPGGTGSGSGGGAGDPLRGAILLQRDIVVSQDVTVFYTTPASATNIRAFRIQASAAGSQGGVETGDEVEIATGLSPTTAIGETRSFQFVVEDVDAGPYFVGLRYAVSGQEYRVRSEYTITMSGIPVPGFVSPASSRSLYGDQTVEIRVNVGDAQNPVNWRLFYIAEDADDSLPPDELGVVIDEGTRNVISQLWSAMGVAPSRYRLGISVTDTGQSVSNAVAAGLTDRIMTVYNDPYIITVLSEPPVARPPRIEITEPAEDVTVGFGVETVTVQYEAEVFEGEASEQRVDFFVDGDDVYDGDEDVLLADRPVDETMATLSTSSLDEGEYYLGAVVYDGVNEPVAGYAEGKIIKEVTPKLTVTEPNVAINRRPNTEVAVAWTTNLPAAAGKVDVYYRRMTDKNGTLSATENRILAPAALSVKTAKFTPTQSGILAVFVRIVLNDGTVLNKQAPAYVKVTSRPSVFWLGDLASPPGGEATATTLPIPPDAPAAGRFYGAVFEGHNYEDNCGSAFMQVVDYENFRLNKGVDFDSDGIDDFMIVARFAKPEFIDPSGIGVGEAYLIRGASARFAGSYNVNATSTSVVPGMVFTGIETPAHDTLGLVNVTRISDADGDTLDELVFSFPRVYNAPASHIPVGGNTRESYLVRPGHFTLGGFVIASSTNDEITNSYLLVDSDTTGGRIALEAVGQNFDSDVDPRIRYEVGPEPDDGNLALCAGTTCWNADLWARYEDAECLWEATFIDQARTGCGPVGPTLAADGAWDSLVEPFFGIDLTLARTWMEWYKARYGIFSFPCAGDVGECPTCVNAAGVDWDCQVLPPEIVCDQDFWSSYLTCGEDRPCDQFYLDGTPVPESGLPEIADWGWDSDSCTFYWLNLIVEASEEQAGLECLEDDIFPLLGTHRPYFELPSLLQSGYFVDRLAGAEHDDDEDDGLPEWNHPLPPYGARVIGRPMDAVHPTESFAGYSVTQSGDYIIFTAPHRTAVDKPTANAAFLTYSEVVTLPNGENPNSGVGYITDLADLWSLGLEDGENWSDVDDFFFEIPPKPHMYLADGGSNVGTPRVPGAPCGYSNLDRKDLMFYRGQIGGWHERYMGGLVITGREDDRLRNVLGIPDFNFDARPDVAIAGPEADPWGTGSQDGAVYVLYRRAPSLEGDYILDKIALAPSNIERLAGSFIKGPQNEGSGFGEVIVGGVDFGTNGVALKSGESSTAELVVSSPYADGNRGEVWIIFAGSKQNALITPEGGANIDQLHTQRRVARIRGSKAGDFFGFNMANAGDIDGDGRNDLLIAAPGATPRYDSNPFDTVDVLDSDGVDRVAPFGEADDIDGPFGIPDGKVNEYDRLAGAGVVYVILSGTIGNKTLEAYKWQTDTTKPMDISIDQIGSELLPGFMLAGRRVGDALGGARASTDNCNKSAYYDPTDPENTCDCSGGLVPVGCEPRDSWDQGRSFGVAGAGDVDDDGYGDILVGSILADPRIDPNTGDGTENAGEAYLIYGFKP